MEDSSRAKKNQKRSESYERKSPSRDAKETSRRHELPFLRKRLTPPEKYALSVQSIIEPIVNNVTTVGIDLAKNVFSVEEW